ncbi:MAG: aspartate carbamoyltransferase [Candidatus Brocadiaceae bacterium]|nr:aspartate carbamoyltransferase [Candidatus Brocadiaceae bacterium]
MTERIESVVSIRDFDRDAILRVLSVAAGMEAEDRSGLLAGCVLGTMFLEPSTRTRMSFASAMVRLGGSVLDLGDPAHSSFKKGESLSDAIRIVAGYCDVIALRHPWEGAARLASQIAGVPVINAGDGSNQHPTQTFLDLYTIQKVCGRIDGLTVGFVGDLKYGRTVHSLVTALSRFDCRQVFVSPPNLSVSADLRRELKEAGIAGHTTTDLREVLPELDIVYCTRIQQERFPDIVEYERVKGAYRIDRELLERAGVKDSMRVMHPLPRVDELAPDVDETPHAVYFEQARNGIPVRQALLAMVLGKV